MNGLQIICVILLVIAGALTLTLIVIFNQKRATSQKLKLLEGMTNNNKDWSSIPILLRMSLSSITSFQTPIARYFGKIINEWDAVEIGRHLHSLNKAGFQEKQRAILLSLFNQSFSKHSAIEIAKLFINAVHGNVLDNDTLNRKRRDEFKDYLLQIIFIKKNYDIKVSNHFAETIQREIDNGLNNENLKILLKAELVKFNLSL